MQLITRKDTKPRYGVRLVITNGRIDHTTARNGFKRNGKAAKKSEPKQTYDGQNLDHNCSLCIVTNICRQLQGKWVDLLSIYICSQTVKLTMSPRFYDYSHDQLIYRKFFPALSISSCRSPQMRQPQHSGRSVGLQVCSIICQASYVKRSILCLEHDSYRNSYHQPRFSPAQYSLIVQNVT